MLSAFITHYLGFTMGLNYSIVLVSIQELWLKLGGESSLYGFSFGSFALGQTVISPLLGYISDVRGLKFTMLISLVFSVVGNGLYAFSFASKSLYMLLFGRFITGLGAGAVALALVYLTNTTSLEQRGSSIATFKLSQALGFLGGPLLGMFVIPLSGDVSFGSNLASRVWNVFTTPTWIALANSIIVLPLLRFGFKNPLAPHMAMKFNLKEARTLVAHTVTLMLISFLASACFWGVASDLFAFAFGQYHLIANQSDMWKSYVSGCGALTVAALLLRLTVHRRISPAMCTILGLTANVLGFALLLDYSIEILHLKNALFFAGIALATSGTAAILIGLGTYYSQKITELSHQARNRRGLFLGLFCFSEAVGRFIGPTFVPLALYIREGEDCIPEKYISDGCSMANVNIAVPALCGVFFVELLAFIYYHLRHGKQQLGQSLLANQELGARPIALREKPERPEPEEEMQD